MNPASTEIPAPTLARRLFRTIALIRAFEESVGKYFARGEIPGFVHLSTGEEAVAAGVCASLDERDKITSTHRGHGHCLARGSDVDRMMAEIYGRETGLCRGRGGTMHIYDLEKGVLGTNGIVAAGGGLACGAAFAAKHSGSGGVAVCFMGDGATDEGATHEAMNLAALWALPVVFVVENNAFSQGTPLRAHTSAPTIADRAAAYSMPGVRVDGQNALAVYEVTREAVERARAGGGPTLIEALTSRFRGHFEGDAMKYTRGDPDAEQATRDPLTVMRAILETEEMTPAAELDDDVASAVRRVAEARQFALDQPRPRPETLLDDVFANQNGSYPA